MLRCWLLLSDQVAAARVFATPNQHVFWLLVFIRPQNALSPSTTRSRSRSTTKCRASRTRVSTGYLVCCCVAPPFSSASVLVCLALLLLQFVWSFGSANYSHLRLSVAEEEKKDVDSGDELPEPVRCLLFVFAPGCLPYLGMMMESAISPCAVVWQARMMSS
jgi:hypothetical protein